MIYHGQAADVLQPAANAGAYRTQYQNNQQDLAAAQFQEQQNEFQQRLAQEAAQFAAADVTRRQTTLDRVRGAADVAAINAQNKEPPAVRDQRRFTHDVDMLGRKQAAAGDTLKQRADDRATALAMQHAYSLAEEQAKQANRKDLADAAAARKVEISKQIKAMDQEFAAKQMAVKQHFAATQQDQRLNSAADIADKVQGRFQRIQQRANLRDRLTTANTIVEQLQKQYASEIEPTRREALRQQIEAAMQTYAQTAHDLDIWAQANAAATQPAPAAATQPAAGQLPTVTTPADYDAIPSGQQYLDPNGNVRIKR